MDHCFPLLPICFGVMLLAKVGSIPFYWSTNDNGVDELPNGKEKK